MKIYLLNKDEKANFIDYLYISAFRNKYDIAANEIIKGIFQEIVNNRHSFLKEYPELKCEISITIINSNQDYFEYKKGFEYRNFGIKAWNDALFSGNDFIYSNIFLEITLPKNFSNKDYNNLNYVLYESIRHELEHPYTFKSEKKPQDEYAERAEKISNLGPINSSEKLFENCKLMSEQITNSQEISPFAKSIYFVSKKKNQHYENTIDEVLNRTFYHNNLENIKLGKEDKRIISLFNDTKNKLIMKIQELFPNSRILMKSL